MNSHRDGETGPPLSPENTRVLEDIKLITRILSDPVIDQEYHRIRTEILRKRRIHRGRLALAGALFLLAGTAAFGYLAAKTKKPPDAVSAPSELAALKDTVPKTVPAIAEASGPSKLDPLALAKESMVVNGRNVPIFGPLEEASDPSRPTYVYLAHVRVVEVRYEKDTGRVALKLDWTVPQSTLEEKEASLGGAAKWAKANLQPLPIRWYEVALNAGDLAHVIARPASGDALINPSSENLIYVDVPESATLLRKRLTEAKYKDVALRVRAGYDFTRVARGSISLSKTGSAIRRVFDEVRPRDRQGDVPPEMWVGRWALDEIASRIHERIVQSGRNSGLSPESWKALQANADRSLSSYFESLHAEKLGDLINRDADLWIVYTAESGELSAARDGRRQSHVKGAIRRLSQKRRRLPEGRARCL